MESHFGKDGPEGILIAVVWDKNTGCMVEEVMKI